MNFTRLVPLDESRRAFARLSPRRLGALLLLTACGMLAGLSRDASAFQAGSNCVFVEIYVKNDCPKCAEYEQALNDFAAKRAGVKVKSFNIDAEPKYLERLNRIRQHFKLESAEVPVVYGCNSFLHNLDSDKQLLAAVERMLTITAYVRAGCPHCAAAKRFLPGLMRKYPAFRLAMHDVISDDNAHARMEAVVRRYRKSASSLPVIQICNQLVIGYDEDETTGKRLDSILDYWSSPCTAGESKESTSSKSSFLDDYRRGIDRESLIVRPRSVQAGLNAWLLAATVAFAENEPTEKTPESKNEDETDEALDDNLLPLPASEGSGAELSALDDLEYAPLPPIGDGEPIAPAGLVDDGDLPLPPMSSGIGTPETMSLPVFGSISYRKVGMPAFTLLVGLVDGFNPCAMWVLLFLLSLLVNLKSRAKIVAVAGTFVVISGLAYFAFMAAWLSVLSYVAYLPHVQMTLGMFATFIGAIHVKDFFAFGKGISFSIPESAKPGIYSRARKIVMAENLTGAIAGAIVLAVLVNFIELLCTAGLPALYTEILRMQNYPPWKNYAMLGLYNLAYMFDDSLMVGLVVITLGKRKLQENEGRWLKLFSGLFILALGLIMIFKPDMLV